MCVLCGKNPDPALGTDGQCWVITMRNDLPKEYVSAWWRHDDKERPASGPYSLDSFSAKEIAFASADA